MTEKPIEWTVTEQPEPVERYHELHVATYKTKSGHCLSIRHATPADLEAAGYIEIADRDRLRRNLGALVGLNEVSARDYALVELAEMACESHIADPPGRMREERDYYRDKLREAQAELADLRAQMQGVTDVTQLVRERDELRDSIELTCAGFAEERERWLVTLRWIMRHLTEEYRPGMSPGGEADQLVHDICSGMNASRRELTALRARVAKYEDVVKAAKDLCAYWKVPPLVEGAPRSRALWDAVKALDATPPPADAEARAGVDDSAPPLPAGERDRTGHCASAARNESPQPAAGREGRAPDVPECAGGAGENPAASRQRSSVADDAIDDAMTGTPSPRGGEDVVVIDSVALLQELREANGKPPLTAAQLAERYGFKPHTARGGYDPDPFGVQRAAGVTPPAADADENGVPRDVHERGWQWRPVGDGAFAPPFGSIRVCRVCGCLVAGGPTACGRCVASERAADEATPPTDAARLAREVAGPYSIGSTHWPGLSKLVEELGEALQVVGKLLGTGGASAHWDGSDLRARLVEELGDQMAAALFVITENRLGSVAVAERQSNKLELFRKWHREALERAAGGEGGG